MIYKAAIAIDYSGSTSNNLYYWNTVKKVVENFISKCKQLDIMEEEICFVSWNDQYIFETKDKIINRAINRSGTGGTYPIGIVNALFEKQINNHICIITDGEVSTSDIDSCDSAIANYSVDNVECHIINNRPNVSVSCPFTRKNTSSVYTYIPGSYLAELVVSTDKKDYEILEQIDSLTFDTFNHNIDTITKCLIQLNIGTSGNIHIKDRLIAAKKRFLAEQSKAISIAKDYTSIFTELLSNNTIDTNKTITTVKELLLEAHSSTELERISSVLDKCISMCGSIRTNFNINDIKSNAFNRSATAKKIEIETIEPIAIEEANFECPITYDLDCPGILIDGGEAILVGIDKGLVDYIVECPLRLLNYPELVAKTKSRIGQVVGCQTIDSLNGQNPFTRRQIQSIYPLGQTSNHLKACDYSMDNLFCKGKCLGNIEMWNLVFYFICKQLDYCNDYIEQINNNIKHRCNTRKTYISCSGSPNLASTKTSIAVASWWVPATSIIFNNGILPNRFNDILRELELDPVHDPVRFHIDTVNYFMEIASLCFPGSIQTFPEIRQNVLVTKWAMGILKIMKKDNKYIDLARNAAIGLIQNTIVTYNEPDSLPMIVILDGDTNENSIEKTRFILEDIFCINIDFFNNSKEICQLLVKMTQTLNPGMSVSDIDLISISKKPDYITKYEWKYALDTMDNANYNVPISYKTFRPFYNYKIDDSDTTCVENANKIFGSVGGYNNSFKGNKYLLQYIVDYRAIPSLEQFLVYSYTKIKQSSILNKTTLPICVADIYKWIMNDYKEVFDRANMEGLSIETIIERINASVSQTERIKIEMDN